MKSIAFQDVTGGSIMVFNPPNKTMNHHERIKEGLKELEHTGMIKVFLIRGKKIRKLFSKTY